MKSFDIHIQDQSGAAVAGICAWLTIHMNRKNNYPTLRGPSTPSGLISFNVPDVLEECGKTQADWLMDYVQIDHETVQKIEFTIPTIKQSTETILYLQHATQFFPHYGTDLSRLLKHRTSLQQHNLKDLVITLDFDPCEMIDLLING